MDGVQFNFWAIVILLGAVQGLFLSVYLFLKKENRTANKWLAFLLTSVSLHLIEYAADIAGLTLQYPFFIAITYPLLFLWGPVYYFYCRKLLDNAFKPSYKSILHFIPSVLVLLLMLPFYSMDAKIKMSYLQGLANEDVFNIPIEQLVFLAVHVVQTVAYIFAANKFIGKKKKELKDYSSDVLVAKKLEWLNSFNWVLSVYLLLYCLLVVLLSVVNKYQVQLDYAFLLITSVLMYAIGYSAIGNPEIFKAIPDSRPRNEEVDEQTSPKDSKNQDRFPELKERLLHYMSSNKPYLKSDLKISDLANLLSVPSYQLSQLINDEFLVNFYDFINKYRIEEAKKLLIEDVRNYKILSIAYEVGFNSKATFNRVFKKFTDLTPSVFKEKYSSLPKD